MSTAITRHAHMLSRIPRSQLSLYSRHSSQAGVPGFQRAIGHHNKVATSNRPEQVRSATVWLLRRNGHKGLRPSMFACSFSSRIDERGGSSINALCWTIIGISGVVFFLWNRAKYIKDNKTLQRLYENTLLSWNNVMSGRWWVLFTSAVTHINAMHFAFNMLALNTFAGILAMVPGIGGFQVLALVLGSSLASSVAWLKYEAWRASEAVESGRAVRPATACGLSGVVEGLAAVAACVLPKAPMSFFGVGPPMPLYLMVGLFISVDLFFIGSGDRIGHSAHLGGFAYGLLHYLVFIRRLRIPGSWLQPKPIANQRLMSTLKHVKPQQKPRI